MEEKKDTYLSQVKQIGALTAVPIILLTGPAVGYFIGGWIDRKFQSGPWFTVLFLVLGFTAAGREVFRLLKQIQKEDNSKKDPE
jgi:ATP synthase protein I